MTFLREELEELPDELSKLILSQLETTLRRARHLGSHPASDVSHLHYVAICANISSLLELADNYKKVLSQRSGDGTDPS